MSESQKSGEWRTVPAGKRGQVFSIGDVADWGIEEAVVEGFEVERTSGQKLEGCRVVNQLVETDK